MFFPSNLFFSKEAFDESKKISLQFLALHNGAACMGSNVYTQNDGTVCVCVDFLIRSLSRCSTLIQGTLFLDYISTSLHHACRLFFAVIALQFMMVGRIDPEKVLPLDNRRCCTTLYISRQFVQCNTTLKNNCPFKQ